MTADTPPLHPADELAAVRRGLARLRLRERALQRRLLDAGAAGRLGAEWVATVEVREGVRLQAGRLPPWLLADPRLFRLEERRVMRLDRLAPPDGDAPRGTTGADAGARAGATEAVGG